MKNKDTKYSPYATNKGGKIESPRTPDKNGPKSIKIVGDDLRVKRG